MSYNLPAGRWIHLQVTNRIEPTFATVWSSTTITFERQYLVQLPEAVVA